MVFFGPLVLYFLTLGILYGVWGDGVHMWFGLLSAIPYAILIAWLDDNF